MQQQLLLKAYAILALTVFAFACSLEVNEPTRPGGTGIHVDVPGNAMALTAAPGAADFAAEVERCEGGYAAACHAVRDVHAVAVRCDEGSHSDCNRFGHWLLAGDRGLGQDAAAAATFVTSACDAGFAGACRSLGNMALAGQGVERSAELALGRFQRACDLGLVDACIEMANHGLSGSLNVENAVAREMLVSACHAGHAGACVQRDQQSDAAPSYPIIRTQRPQPEGRDDAAAEGDESPAGDDDEAGSQE